MPKQVEEKRHATWGTEIPDDLVLDETLLAEALKKVSETLVSISVACSFFTLNIGISSSFQVPYEQYEKRVCHSLELACGQEDARRREEKDERKRKYNVRWNDEVCFC